MAEVSSVGPAAAVEEMRGLSMPTVKGAQRVARDAGMAEIMVGVLKHLAEEGKDGWDDYAQIVIEWEMRDEWPRCPECRGLADEHDGPDETVLKVCVDGCGYREVIE